MKGRLNCEPLFSFAFLACLFFAACSFDYGNSQSESGKKPDIVMENVEYVRFRSGNPQMRFQAESAERYEERQTMNLREFTFEQFENQGTEINAIGRAGEALVELDTGNISLSGGVRIEIDSEDVIMETSGLHWHDAEKQLSGWEDDEVEIYRSDGTSFIGRGFSANIRYRTWEFTAGAQGYYVDKDDDEEDEVNDEEDP